MKESILTCKDCGSTAMIIDVVDFCTDCRSYNVAHKFEDGTWDEATPEEIEDLNIKEEKRIADNQQRNRDISIPVSLIINVFQEIGNLIYDYNRTYNQMQTKVKLEYGKEFRSKKNIFSFYDISSDRHKLSNGELKEVFISSIIKGSLNRLKQREDVFKNADIELLDRTKLDIALKELDYPNRKKFFYKNDIDDSWDYVIA